MLVEMSVARTCPVGRARRAAINAESPAPAPTSSTQLPVLTPARSSIVSVAGPRASSRAAAPRRHSAALRAVPRYQSPERRGYPLPSSDLIAAVAVIVANAAIPKLVKPRGRATRPVNVSRQGGSGRDLLLHTHLQANPFSLDVASPEGALGDEPLELGRRVGAATQHSQ